MKPISNFKYDIVIVTQIPAFYKVNLYNALAEHRRIYVIFIGNNSLRRRSADFHKLRCCRFEYSILHSGNFQERSVLSSCSKLVCLLAPLSYKNLLLSGWNLPEFWVSAFISRKRRNWLVLESGIEVSNISVLYVFVKQVILARMSGVFPSGDSHLRLLGTLGYSGKTVKTRGVGLIDCEDGGARVASCYKRRFLYVGRLSQEKNLTTLIEVFNSLPEFCLTLVGDGPEGRYLRGMSNTNIHFVGEKNNTELSDIFLEHDVLLLLSFGEAWGLVVEEAMCFGLPVIVSTMCGASELVRDGENGYIVDPGDKEYLRKVLVGIDDEKYASLWREAGRDTQLERKKQQISAYLDVL